MTAIGIDVGKAALDVFVDDQSLAARYPNTRSGIGQLVRWLRCFNAPKIVVEATGGHEEPLLEACCEAGLWVSRVNPRQAKAFARATGTQAKTDAIDARLLALMARMFGDRLRPYVASRPW